MSGLSYNQANKQRFEFQDYLRMISYEYVNSFNCINPAACVDWDKFYTYTDKEIVMSNDTALANSSIIVVFNKSPMDIKLSFGTLYEIFVSGYLNKPVFVIGDKVEHPHIRESVTKWFDNHIECAEYIIDNYGQIR